MIIQFEKDRTLVVGYISYEPYYTLYMDPGLNITALVVDNQYQNKGIGKALILEAEKYAKKNSQKKRKFRKNIIN